MNISIQTLLNRSFIAYAILLEPITKLLFGVAMGRLHVLPFLFLCFLANLHDKTFRYVLVKTPVMLWLLWCIYSFINWYLAGVLPENGTLMGFVCQHFMIPLAMLIMVYYEGMKDLKGTILTIVLALCVYMLMGLTMQNMAGTGSGTNWSARGGEQLGNSLPLNACVLVFTVLFARVHEWIKSWHLYMAVILGLVAIFSVATRKALGGVMILFVFYIAAKMMSFSVKRFVGLLFLCGTLYLSFSWVMDNTLIGKRMNEIEKVGKESNKTDIAILNKLGDRASHYILGWEVFQKHPVTGIGIKNSNRLFHMRYPLHTEYMVQLAENGIVGTVIWLLFIGSILRVIWQSQRHKSRSVLLVCLSGMVCILFLDLTTWTYEFPRYFAIYGLVLASCDLVTIYKEDILSRQKAMLYFQDGTFCSSDFGI